MSEVHAEMPTLELKDLLIPSGNEPDVSNLNFGMYKDNTQAGVRREVHEHRPTPCSAKEARGQQ